MAACLVQPEEERQGPKFLSNAARPSHNSHLAHSESERLEQPRTHVQQPLMTEWTPSTFDKGEEGRDRAGWQVSRERIRLKALHWKALRTRNVGEGFSLWSAALSIHFNLFHLENTQSLLTDKTWFFTPQHLQPRCWAHILPNTYHWAPWEITPTKWRSTFCQPENIKHHWQKIEGFFFRFQCLLISKWISSSLGFIMFNSLMITTARKSERKLLPG